MLRELFKRERYVVKYHGARWWRERGFHVRFREDLQ